MRMLSADHVIETENLTKRFGRKRVVDALNLSVPRGSVFAFIGRNGAGKTTTIRMLLHLLGRTDGRATVLGMDSVRQSFEISKRTGYVAQDQRMVEWMKVDQAIWFWKQFRPMWDDALASDLKKRLQLPGETRVRSLSHGMRTKLALLLATAFRPDLLILDEPTGGLDPVARHEFAKGVVERAAEEGTTVFFSSHQVHELERVADWVAILDCGRLVRCSPLDELKASVKRLVLTFRSQPASLSSVPGLLSVETEGRQAAIVVQGFSDDTIAAVRALEPTAIRVENLSLEPIFIALADRREVA